MVYRAVGHSMTLAIRATAVRLGEREVSHAELAVNHHVSEAIVAAALGDMIVYATEATRIELARDAVQSCLAKAGITIDDVDLLISCRGRFQEAEPPLEMVLGRPQLPVLSIQGGCPIILRAIWLARAWLRSEQARRVLVVYAETSGSDYRVFGELGPDATRDVFSDGAAAILVEDGHGLVLRSFAAVETGEWWSNRSAPSPVAQQNDLRALRDSVNATKTAFARCLADGNLNKDDVAAFALPNEADAMIRFEMRQLRVPVERVFRAHPSPSRVWAVDPIFNLEQLLERGVVSPGGIVVCGARAVGGAAFLALEVPGAS